MNITFRDHRNYHQQNGNRRLDSAVLFVVGIAWVRPYLAERDQIEADEIAINAPGCADALISGMKKLVESPEVRADQKKYRLTRRSLYGRMVRIQELSRSLTTQNAN
jgi:hypothetical protein